MFLHADMTSQIWLRYCLSAFSAAQLPAKYTPFLLDKGARLGRQSQVLAFNVNLFERQPASALQVIKTHLLPDGALYLFYQPPLAEKTRRIAERVEHNLQANGFSVREITTNDLRPTPAVCLIANAE